MMEMEDTVVCHICLVTNVKMYDLQTHAMDSYYEQITGVNPLHSYNNSNLVPHVCYECASLLKKYYYFRQKCLQAQNLLYGITDADGKVSVAKLKLIDREEFHLTSSLTQNRVSENTVFDYIYFSTVSKSIKIEEEFQSSAMPVLDIVKEEDIEEDIDDPTLDAGFTSDENEPLSLHKEMKVKCDEIQIENNKEEVTFNVELIESNENLEVIKDFNNDNSQGLLIEVPPKLNTGQRGRPRKLVAEVAIEPKGAKSRNIARELEEYATVFNLSVEEQMEEINKRKQSSNYLNSPFQCDLCYKGFIDTDAWNHHLSKHAVTAGDIECVVCKFRFKNKRAFQKHAVNHEKKYACKSCPYISSNTTQARQHQRWHNGVTYKCQYCDDIFNKWTSYMSHVRIKHPSEFICGVCGYSFVSKLGLNMHKTMMHKEHAKKPEKKEQDSTHYCEECDVKFVSTEAWKRHLVMSAKHTSSTESINGCRMCGETFPNSEELRLHHRKEHARKRPKNYGKKTPSDAWPSKCEHCSEEIPNARQYWMHFRRAHPGEKYPIQKNYVCDICGKSFRGNAFLVYHRRTHFEERSYKCSQCGKAFFNRSNLHMHEKTHSESRPFPCTVCFKAFKGKGALERHFRCHTGIKPYECEYCGKAFSQSNSRKIHVITVHLKQPAPYLSKTRVDRKTKQAQPKETPTQQFIF